jgi:hypothetical protein
MCQAAKLLATLAVISEQRIPPVFALDWKLHSKAAEESNSGLIGAEYLAWNFAVIDVGGMALYLRHPDSR